MNCSLGRKQSKREYKEESISDQPYSFLRVLTYKPQTFPYDGLHADPVPRFRANCKLAVLATACGSKNKHGRAVWVCHKYLSCASGRHRRFLQIPYTAPRETKNSISKEVRLNFSATLFVFSQWRTFMKGLFSSLSPLHTVCLHYTSPVKDLLCFLSRLLLRCFCNSFHFSWDSTC